MSSKVYSMQSTSCVAARPALCAAASILHTLSVTIMMPYVGLFRADRGLVCSSAFTTSQSLSGLRVPLNSQALGVMTMFSASFRVYTTLTQVSLQRLGMAMRAKRAHDKMVYFSFNVWRSH